VNYSWSVTPTSLGAVGASDNARTASLKRA